jgi:tetratricopeptide (TPR) repeat protein
MKRKSNVFFRLAVTAFVLLAAVSCSKKLNPLTSDYFSVVPSPLELVGTQVPATVNGKFPEKWFNKNAVVTITPVLKYDGQEALGTSYTYQGEKVAGNGIVVPNKAGAPFTLKSSFNYVPAMRKSELYLRFDASIKGKKIALPDVKVADGVNATADLATALASTPALAPDAFQRVIKETHDANIHFLIQQAALRKSELSSADLAAWKKLVEDAINDEKRNVNVEVSAYASPDGGVKLNEGLAGNREKNTTQYLKKDFKKKSVNPEINAKYTAQDWDGFKQLLEASNIQDKELVLRVLSLYPDPETREREIKNISVVFKELAETILPQLRRSRLTANVEIIGKSDEELKSAWTADKSALSVEELLYLASLDNTDKKAVYAYVTEKYPSDYRGWNNLGNAYFQQGDVAKAAQAYNKAASLSSNAAATNANLGLLAINSGDLAKAQQYLGNASGANSLSETLGLLYLKQGDYAKAAQAFGDAKTNNAAVAQILVKNYSKAQQTLDAVPVKDANTSYLAAIVAARTNNASGVVANLKAATQKDASLAKKALIDLEFAKFLTNPDVANVLK